MPTIARFVVAMVLLAIAAFTAYGFAATFEPPGFLGWRIGYAVGGVLCLTGAGWVLFRKRPSA